MDFISQFKSIKLKELDKSARERLFSSYHLKKGNLCAAILSPLTIRGYNNIIEYFLNDSLASRIAILHNEKWESLQKHQISSGNDIKKLIDFRSTPSKNNILHLEFREPRNTRYSRKNSEDIIHLYFHEKKGMLKTYEIHVPFQNQNLFTFQWLSEPWVYEKVIAVYPISPITTPSLDSLANNPEKNSPKENLQNIFHELFPSILYREKPSQQKSREELETKARQDFYNLFNK